MTTPSSSSHAAALTPDAAFSLERWSASSGSDRTSRASLVLVGGGRRWYAHSNGNGAIDALMRSVDEALARVLTSPVDLMTYNVHASGHGHATAATVTLSVRDAGPRFMTTSSRRASSPISMPSTAWWPITRSTSPRSRRSTACRPIRSSPRATMLGSTPVAG